MTQHLDLSRAIVPGAEFEIAHPFIHSTHDEWDNEGVSTRACWAPGVLFVDLYDGDVESVAQGVGKQILTVLGEYQVKGFPKRIFYTRKWMDPNGRVFGKRALRIATMQKFKRLVNGYQHKYVLRSESLPKGVKKEILLCKTAD